MRDPLAPEFTQLVELAGERVGGRALAASDDFFAGKENLLKAKPAIFLPEEYTERGKWMDGWESRRKRGPGHDWCVIRLGVAGRIEGLNVDTHHFSGNHPEAFSLDGLALAEGAAEAVDAMAEHWREIVSRTPLNGDSDNYCAVALADRWTHLRLHIYPDGGVARLRVFGRARPDWKALAARSKVDLVAVAHGGRVVDCSDRTFSDPSNLTLPGRSTSMGDGWETRRRRGPGHDWCILALGHRGVVEEVVVDTHHFKGNFPESCALEGCAAPGASREELLGDGREWRPLVERTPLEAHREHRFSVSSGQPVTHVRLRIFPDGGVSRLRVLGRVVGAEGE